MVRRILPAFVLMIAACGGADDWEDGRPRIDELRFKEQSPHDPFSLEFLIRFFDSDGDSGRGTLHLSLDGDESSALPMSDLFEKQSPPLALETPEGEFEVVVRVSSAVEVGDELKFGFIIEDAAGRRSNDPWVSLRAEEGS